MAEHATVRQGSQRAADTTPTGTDTAGDDARVAVYRLLAGLLAAPPTSELIAALAAVDVPADGDTEAAPALASPWRGLRDAAAQTTAPDAEDEFHELFIGISRGELMPYGSWYLAGAIMSLPLARLRRALAALGIERQPDVHEPEDHASAICDAMGLVIESSEIPREVEVDFFRQHVGSWLPRFFADLRDAKAARFYAAVGELGGAFLALEQDQLDAAEARGVAPSERKKRRTLQ